MLKKTCHHTHSNEQEIYTTASNNCLSFYIFLLLTLPFHVLYTLIRKSRKWCVFTQAWGSLSLQVICVCSILAAQFHRNLVNSSTKCTIIATLTYILQIHVNKFCKIKLTLNLFHQVKSVCNTKVVWLWWYKLRYLFLMRVYLSTQGNRIKVYSKILKTHNYCCAAIGPTSHK